MKGWRQAGAETLGVFVFVAAGGFALAALDEGIALLAAPAVFGLAIGLMVYTLSRTSGAHLNPAITIALTLTHRHPPRMVIPYIVAQLTGATAAALLVIKTTGDPTALLTRPAAGLPIGNTLVVEALATGLLGFVIAHAADHKHANGSVPAAPIGAAVLVGALFAGPFTGGSMNPARTLGPAFVAAEFTGLWIYLLAPVAGAALGMLLHDLLVHRATPSLHARPAATEALLEGPA